MKKNDYDLIHKYLWGELSDSEAKEVEERRQNDTAFAAALREEEEMKAFLKKQPAREKLEKASSNLGNQYFQADTPPKQKVKRRWLYGIAAAAVIAAVFLMTWLWAFPPTAQELYQTYAVHYPLEMTERSSGGSLAAIDKAFNSGEYASAVPLLESHLVQQRADNYALLYYGIAMMESGQVEKALNVFEFLAGGTSLYNEDAKWYRALALLKMERIEEAKEALAEIPRESSRYASARKLQRQL
ncbi:MAG: hypothetical protein GYB31_03885 [Bacteroidetes bacterium]|nr:hypothetical protein [Bacteroidota bacterium]